MQDFDRRVAPVRGLDALVLPAGTRRLLEEIVLAEKARNVLFGQWGFDQQPGASRGIAALFQGAPGTGKSLAAEAVGYEVGHPLTVVNCAELVSKYVGETGKNIEIVFKEAAQNESILVFDEADGLFGKRTGVYGSSDRYANMDVGLLLYHIERFPGIVLLTTNLLDQIDEAFFRRLRFVVEFLAPDPAARHELWQRLLPAKTPVALDVDLCVLARHPLTGGQIRNIILRAASRTALRAGEARILGMIDLEEAVTEELRNGRRPKVGFAASGA
jgi:SpoVK/Ycf46/Vps4 family AAA+-type ATPase